MIKDICKDQFLLSMKSTPASIDDMDIAIDLLDTLKHNEQYCVGMAANMIGILKNIIAVNDQGRYIVMFNPKILKFSGQKYETEEGCLSHDNMHKVIRFESIKVEYYDMKFKKIIKNYNGLTAQIIQHEIDHLNGVLI